MKKYILNNKKVMIGYSLLAIIAYACLTLMFECYSLITTVVEEPESHDPILVTAACIGVLAVLLVLLNAMAAVKRRVIYGINVSFRGDIFSVTYDLGSRRYEGKDKEFYESILINDIEVLQDDFFANVIEFVGDAFQLAIMLGSIALVGWKYLLVVVVFTVPSVLHPFILKNKLEKNTEALSEEKESFTGSVGTLLRSFLVFKSYHSGRVFTDKMTAASDSVERKSLISRNWRVINSCLMALFVYILKIGSQLFFINNAINGVITVATVSLLLGLANNVGNPIASLLGYISVIGSTKPIREKCEAFLASGIEEERTAVNDGTVIRFDGVSFTYDGSRQILNKLSAEFLPGTKYAIFGPSGCGKSTLLRLLQRYEDPGEGSITIGSVDVGRISNEAFNRTVVSISQTPFMFAGSLRENLTMFKDGISDEALWQALKTAGIDGRVNELEGGLDAEVKPDGSNFSGGEKQRFSIARALLSNAPILLMDEGMSALDNETAERVETNLLSLKDKTIISISHRIQKSTRLYDRILVMDKGVIAESGDYRTMAESSVIFGNYLKKGEEANEA